MLNRLFLAGAAMLLAAPAFAQTPTVTTTYASAPTITAGGCTITGATTFQYNPSTNTLVLQNATDSCSNNPPPPGQASVTVSINPSTYVVGSGAAAPVISVTNNTPAAQVVCNLNPTNGFTVTGNPVTNSGQFTLSTPTTAGTFSFQPVCTTNTSGYNPTASVNTVSLNVTTTISGCGAGPQPSTPINGVTFQRQCNGMVYMLPSSVTYNGPLSDVTTVLGTKASGQSPTFQIQSGYYVALSFTPTASTVMQFVANPSYGDSGFITVSTSPGGLVKGSPGVICSLNYGSSNSVYISPTASICPVTVGQTYYLNFADTDSNGTFLCYGGAAGSCATSAVSYTAYLR